MEKTFLKSKTLWVNALVFIGTIAGIKELAPDLSEEIVIAGLAVVNIVLRFLTKDPITLL
jgi:hypothetical protein